MASCSPQLERSQEMIMRKVCTSLKVVNSAAAVVRLIRSPSKTSAIFTVADTLNDLNLIQPLVERLAREPAWQETAEAVRDRYLLPAIDLESLGRLPRGTLGRAYADFMRDRG